MPLDRVIMSAAEGEEGKASDREALAEYGLEPEAEKIADPVIEQGADPGDENKPKEAVVETPAAETDDDSDEAAFADATEKQKGRWAKRTEAFRRIEAENAELKKQVEAAKKVETKPDQKPIDARKPEPAKETTPTAVAPAAVPPAVPFADAQPVEPKLADFLESEDPQTAFLAARTDWNFAMREWKSDKKAWEKAEAERVEKASKELEAFQSGEAERTKAARTKLDQQIAAARAAHTDFDSIVSTDKFSAGIMAVAMNPELCDNGPEVLHYLASHPELLEKINSLTSATQTTKDGVVIASLESYNRAMREIAKVEDRMNGVSPASTPSPVTIPQAPPAAKLGKPPSAVGSGGVSTPSGEPDFDKLADTNDLEGYRKLKARKAN